MSFYWPNKNTGNSSLNGQYGNRIGLNNTNAKYMLPIKLTIQL